MSESSVNSAINTATTIVGTPLQWLDVLVTSVLSGAVALAVGLLAIIVLSVMPIVFEALKHRFRRQS